jgi:hypothetical protein
MRRKVRLTKFRPVKLDDNMFIESVVCVSQGVGFRVFEISTSRQHPAVSVSTAGNRLSMFFAPVGAEFGVSSHYRYKLAPTAPWREWRVSSSRTSTGASVVLWTQAYLPIGTSLGKIKFFFYNRWIRLRSKFRGT